jgi:hypothetical protein
VAEDLVHAGLHFGLGLGLVEAATTAAAAAATTTTTTTTTTEGIICDDGML